MNYHDILKTKIKQMITNDLTIGMTDNNLIAYSSDSITKFIQDNNDSIEKTIETIIHDYSNDNELELLEEPLWDWIAEYLYDFIDIKSLFLQ